MKVISKNKVLLHNDRRGELKEHVQIDLRVVNRDPDTKLVHLEARDSIIYNPDTEDESISILRDRDGEVKPTKYSVSFEEYEEQEAQLRIQFADEISNMPEHEIEGFLLQQRLLYNLIVDLIYCDGADWLAR